MPTALGFAFYLPLILALALLIRWEFQRLRRTRLSKERLEIL